MCGEISPPERYAVCNFARAAAYEQQPVCALGLAEHPVPHIVMDGTGGY
jgi:hypothetical protein